MEKVSYSLMSLTLKQAQKFLSKLKEFGKSAKSRYGQTSDETTTQVIISGYVGDELTTKLQQEKERLVAKVAQIIAIKSDTLRLKNALFEANTKYGIADLMSKIEIVNMELSLYENAVPVELPSIRATSIQAVNVCAFETAAELAPLIKKLKARRLKLEGERDRLNSEHHIEFEFSEASRDYLGL